MKLDVFSVTAYPNIIISNETGWMFLLNLGDGSSSVRTLGIINTVPLNDWTYRKYSALSF